MPQGEKQTTLSGVHALECARQTHGCLTSLRRQAHARHRADLSSQVVHSTERLLADCAENVESVQRMSRQKTEQLNIGYVANIYHDLLPATLGAFRKACPNTALNLFDMTPAEQYQALDECRIDLGFVGLRPRSSERYRDLPWARFAHDRIMAVIPKEDSIARRSNIGFKELEPKFFVGLSEKTSGTLRLDREGTVFERALAIARKAGISACRRAMRSQVSSQGSRQEPGGNRRFV